MKALVTGGTGYIGSHTSLALLEAGHEVVVLDNLSNSERSVLQRLEKLSEKSVSFEECDVRDAPGLRRVFERHQIDVVLHFAALKAVGESVALPLEYYANNIGGLVTLLQVMMQFDCFRMVLSSSATVYGNASQPPFSETAPLEATNPYGRTKLYSEEILRDLSVAEPRLSAVLLRYFNPVGAHASGLLGESPRGLPNNLFPYVTRVARGELPELKIYGNDYDTPDGTGVRDYIHVWDLALGHVAALAMLSTSSGVQAINLGTGRGYSVLEVVRAFEQASQRPVPYQIVARRPGDVAVSLAEPTRARELLGWTARLGLSEMCEDGWRWGSSGKGG